MDDQIIEDSYKILGILLAGLLLLNRREPSLFLAFILDKKETVEDLTQAPFKDFIGSAEDSPLVKHMNTFASEEGLITKKSIFEACIKKWHLTEEQANTLAVGTLQVAWLRRVPGVTFSVFKGISGGFRAEDAVGLLTHPSDTGLYDMEGGTVNADRFDELEKYATTNEKGEVLITQTRLTNYLSDWYRVDKRWEHSSWLYKFIGSAGNKGEYEIFFSQCHSRFEFNPETNQMEPAILLNDLKAFLMNSYDMVKAVEAHDLPAKPVSLWEKVTKYVQDVVEQCPSYFPPDNPSYWRSNSSYTFYKAEASQVSSAQIAPPSTPMIGNS